MSIYSKTISSAMRSLTIKTVMLVLFLLVIAGAAFMTPVKSAEAAALYCFSYKENENPRESCHDVVANCAVAFNSIKAVFDTGSSNITDLSAGCYNKTVYNPGTISFERYGYTTTEDAGSITITVKRSVGDAAVTVKYVTAPGSRGGTVQNYQDVSGTFTWADGDMSSRSFTVPLIDDSEGADPDVATLQLVIISGEGTIGNVSSITINDDEREEAIACVEAGYSCVSPGSCRTVAPAGAPDCTAASGDVCCAVSYKGDSCTVDSFTGSCTDSASCSLTSGASATCGTGGYVCCYDDGTEDDDGGGGDGGGGGGGDGGTPPGGAGTIEDHGVGSGFVPCSGVNCSACHFITMANSIINWLIGLLLIIFAFIMVVAGFRLVVSAKGVGAMDDAKQKFINALIGLLIVLTAWLIVSTVIKVLVSDSGEVYGRLWTTIQCHVQTRPTIEAEGGADTWGEGSYSSTTADNLDDIGEGNEAIVDCAEVFDAQQCLYSQARRNGCTGDPGYTDCSDLVSTCFQAAGCSSPGASTASMYPRATAIGATSSLRPGDSIVYRHGGTGHVVICMNDGCTQVIHASGRGAPDGQPATVPPADQIKISNSSYYLSQAGARVLRASDYCD